MNVDEAAIAYAQKGWRVFPLHSIRADLLDLVCTCGRRDCSSAGKHPRLRHGVLEASSDPAVVEAWWRQWPDANVGLATGVGSGVYVVDLDGPDAIAAWRELALPAGWRSITGGGEHHVYSIAEPLPSTHWKLGRGIDTRGDGGYIVAPPSMHRTGRRYRWDDHGDGHPPSLPAAIVEALTPTAIATPAAPPRISFAGTTPYGEGVLRNGVKAIRLAPKGARNSTLNDRAFIVGQFVGGGEINPIGIAEILVEASTDEDRKKVRTTVERALHDGAMHPKSAPKGDD